MIDNEQFLLVLDANVLIRDFWWSGAEFRQLLETLAAGHWIVVPEVALLEAR